MGPPMPQEQAGPPQAPVQSEQQAMAMMGMMGGGRVPYASGIAAVARPQKLQKYKRHRLVGLLI